MEKTGEKIASEVSVKTGEDVYLAEPQLYFYGHINIFGGAVLLNYRIKLVSFSIINPYDFTENSRILINCHVEK